MDGGEAFPVIQTIVGNSYSILKILVSISQNESVQAPEELERMNSIEENIFSLEGNSFMQTRIPFAIPTVNALSHTITRNALICSNCNEKRVAKQTFCFPDWCTKCDESLWSTRGDMTERLNTHRIVIIRNNNKDSITIVKR